MRNFLKKLKEKLFGREEFTPKYHDGQIVMIFFSESKNKFIKI